MPDIGALVAANIGAIKLKILVFGPQVATPSTDPRTAKLQAKRVEIRAKLEHLGHDVKYAEDLVDPTLPGVSGNAFLQEYLIMSEYDMIVTLVESPGSLIEASVIASKPLLAAKASLFMDEDFRGGLAAQACEFAEWVGAHFQTYQYPVDLDACHLYGFIETRVRKFQTIKFMQ